MIKIILLVLATVLIIPQFCFADVGAGILFIGAGLIAMFLFITPLEAVVYQRMFRVPKTLRASALANLVTTVIGMAGFGFMWVWLILAFPLSVFIEGKILAVFFPQIERKRLWRAVIAANALSYIMLIVVAVFFSEKVTLIALIGAVVCLAVYGIIARSRRLWLLALAVPVCAYIFVALQPPRDRQFLDSLPGEIVYTLRDKKGVSNIYKISANGKNKKLLFANHDPVNSNCLDPVWSAGGSRIGFIAMKNGNWMRFEMGLDGQNVTMAGVEDFSRPQKGSIVRNYSLDVAENPFWLLGYDKPAIIITEKASKKKAIITDGQSPDWNIGYITKP